MSGKQSQYNIGLDKTPANYVPLSPLSFLARSAAVYPDHVSTVYEGRSFTWRETHQRCKRFASYLAGKGIGQTNHQRVPRAYAQHKRHSQADRGIPGNESNARKENDFRPVQQKVKQHERERNESMTSDQASRMHE